VKCTNDFEKMERKTFFRLFGAGSVGVAASSGMIPFSCRSGPDNLIPGSIKKYHTPHFTNRQGC